MKIGILELLSSAVQQNRIEHQYDYWFARQYASIAPQAVAVWCRQLGHKVHYETYYGQQDPKSLLPDDLDVVFISTYTHASALANALGKYYRQLNTLSVIGGPHAKAFPFDCLRFFDLVVRDCDKALIDDILSGRFEPHQVITSGRPPKDIPSVEERMPEIRTANFNDGRRTLFSHVALLTSVGCPYQCDFCVDGDNPFMPFDTGQRLADLRYVAQHMPGVPVGYHDPNFGIRFDETMDNIEAIPEEVRSPYIMESSLSVLKPARMRRLQETNCAFVAPGVEGWMDYSNKAGTAKKTGSDKLAKVVAHFAELFEHVPGLQANFILGTDLDVGDEPFELTKEFILQSPFVFPALNVPVPIGGTPMFDAHLSEERTLKSMPFSFYYLPYLVTKLKNYSPLDYYDKLIEVYRAACTTTMLARRLMCKAPASLKVMFLLRTFSMRNNVAALRSVRDRLAGDVQFRAFHEGDSDALPGFYRRQYRKRLGAYASLLTEAEMYPELSQAPPIPLRHSNEAYVNDHRTYPRAAWRGRNRPATA